MRRQFVVTRWPTLLIIITSVNLLLLSITIPKNWIFEPWCIFRVSFTHTVCSTYRPVTCSSGKSSAVWHWDGSSRLLAHWTRFINRAAAANVTITHRDILSKYPPWRSKLNNTRLHLHKTNRFGAPQFILLFFFAYIRFTYSFYITCLYGAALHFCT